MQVKVVSNILEANEAHAGVNRQRFKNNRVFVLNLMSSPGSGKTSILERTIDHIKGLLRIGVIEGDIYTAKDAERIGEKGVPVVQINTKGACHLDANMIACALAELPLDQLDLLVIENIGNLVCPAEFDLGEDIKAMVLSVTEGNDKPLKYPLMFREAKALLVNKMDLISFTDFDLDLMEKDIRGINPDGKIFLMSAKTGEGFEAWCRWLYHQVQAKKEKSSVTASG
ncbi:MAG: hydrogenase nickel incorporation protein HypB [Bacillota bacterium]